MSFTNAPMTRNRRTVVTFDWNNDGVTQPAVQFERPAEAIGRTKDSKKEHVHFVPNMGWQLRAYQFDYSKLHESAAGQEGTYSVGLGRATVASGFLEKNYQRDPDLTGVTWTGPSSGRPGLSKNVAAGATFDLSLTADKTAFPGPTVSGEPSDVDRVLVTNENHNPGDQAHFWFESPGHSIGGYGLIAVFYFSGPAGSDLESTGFGQYALCLFGDGLARLFERGFTPGDADKVPIWTERFKFIYEPSRQMIPFKTYTVSIVSDCLADENGSYHGTRIAFAIAGLNNTSLTDAWIDTAISAIKLDEPYKSVPVYIVPKLTDEPTTVQPIRIDLRRDVVSTFHVLKSTFPTTGYLEDAPFSIDFYPAKKTDGTDEPFTFQWYAKCPPGTTFIAKLYDAETGVELTTTGTHFSDQHGGRQDYLVAEGKRYYFVKGFWTSDGKGTPTWTSFELIRNPVVDTLSPPLTPVVVDDMHREAPPSLPKAVVTSVTIQGADGEPSHLGAVIRIDDFTDVCAFLRGRDNIAVKIETIDDSGDGDDSIFFTGFTQGATHHFRRGDSRTYPSGLPVEYPDANWCEYTVPCAGEWRKLTDMLAPKRYTYVDKTTKKFWKVTDIVRSLVLSAGVPESKIDIPDNPIPLFPGDTNQNILEPADPVANVAQRLAAEYLGGWIIEDTNAGPDGMWRLLEQKTAPYTILARFVEGHPQDGIVSPVPQLPHVLGAYGTDVVGSQTIPKIFMERESAQYTTERPEGNIVAVYGSAKQGGSTDGNILSKLGGTSKAEMLTQVCVNTSSFNFLNLDPSHDFYPYPPAYDQLTDYLGYMAVIKVFDPTLATEEAVNWVARRVFQVACCARKHLTFRGPLVHVVDSTDTKQRLARPLRHYDMVEVWNGAAYDTYIVKSCVPSYVKDGFQWAEYALVTTTNIGDFAAPAHTVSWEILVARYFKQVVESLGKHQRQNKPQQRGTITRMPDWMALPERTIAPIQNLDPDDPDFGKFLPTLDFDAVA